MRVRGSYNELEGEYSAVARYLIVSKNICEKITNDSYKIPEETNFSCFMPSAALEIDDDFVNKDRLQFLQFHSTLSLGHFLNCFGDFFDVFKKEVLDRIKIVNLKELFEHLVESKIILKHEAEHFLQYKILRNAIAHSQKLKKDFYIHEIVGISIQDGQLVTHSKKKFFKKGTYPSIGFKQANDQLLFFLVFFRKILFMSNHVEMVQVPRD